MAYKDRGASARRTDGVRSQRDTEKLRAKEAINAKLVRHACDRWFRERGIVLRTPKISFGNND